MHLLTFFSVARTVPLALAVCACAAQQDFYRQTGEKTEMAQPVRTFPEPLKPQTNPLMEQMQADIADYSRRLEKWKPQLGEYVICNKKASRLVAAQPGDPLALALAARNLCRDKEAELSAAIYAAYADKNPEFGMESMEHTRKSVLENNIGDIVAFRIKAGARAVPARPAELPPVPEPRI